MFLMTICMSSSTSDAQLSTVMPRIFLFGLTSSQAVLDICSRYGMDAVCSIFSEPGRYYQNTEQIVNPANYYTVELYVHIPVYSRIVRVLRGPSVTRAEMATNG